MRPRKIPLRKCVACQQMKAKKEMIRIVRTPDEAILIDLTGKKAGRGAYLCGEVDCFRLAKKSRALDRALKQAVGPEIYDGLAQDFIAVEDAFNASKDETDDEDEA
ncbi:RNase P modulator RnpM [Paenibacillus sp. R14(2021)]|uniref:RNase P modulator RnpM n=1 Tax=Paenibacillus sp. R14(2021) TaxID=2859228 RepID=UPI001C614CE7|nr:YlxR family protein [Paenibacillus sp. R14(2021)]